MKKPLRDAQRRTIVAQAIRHAERTAPKDDHAFLQALRGHASEKMPPQYRDWIAKTLKSRQS